MWKNANAVTLLMLVLTLSLGACDDEPSSSAPILSVDETKTLDELTDDEWNTIVADLQVYSERFASQANLCRLASVSVAMLMGEEFCESAYDECMNAPDDTSTDFEPLPTIVDQEVACDATVADLEACMEAQGRSIELWFSRLSCSEWDPDLSDIDLTICTELETECPGLIGQSQ